MSENEQGEKRNACRVSNSWMYYQQVIQDPVLYMLSIDMISPFHQTTIRNPGGFE